MQRLEVSCAVRRIYTSLGAKGLRQDRRQRSGSRPQLLYPFRRNLPTRNKQEVLVAVQKREKKSLLLSGIEPLSFGH